MFPALADWADLGRRPAGARVFARGAKESVGRRAASVFFFGKACKKRRAEGVRRPSPFASYSEKPDESRSCFELPKMGARWLKLSLGKNARSFDVKNTMKSRSKFFSGCRLAQAQRKAIRNFKGRLKAFFDFSTKAQTNPTGEGVNTSRILSLLFPLLAAALSPTRCQSVGACFLPFFVCAVAFFFLCFPLFSALLLFLILCLFVCLCAALALPFDILRRGRR